MTSELRPSGEDYREAVLIVQRKYGMARSVDTARQMGVSKPGVSHAVDVLRNGGFLTTDKDGFLHFTDAGQEIAEKIYERHIFFTKQLVAAGVDQETAEQNKSYLRPTGLRPVGRFLPFKGKTCRKPIFRVGCRSSPRSIRFPHPQII